MKRFIPDTFAARTLLVMILGLAISHAISVSLYLTDRLNALTLSGGEHIGERIATIYQMIRQSSKSERQRLVELADRPRLHVTLTRRSAVSLPTGSNRQDSAFNDALIAHLERKIKRDIRIQHQVRTGGTEKTLSERLTGPQSLGDGKVETMIVSLSLSKDSWLNFAVPHDVSKPSWSFRFGFSMAVMLFAVAVLSAMMAHYLTRPLALFSRAAQRLGVDVRAPPLREEGPVELREATRAFNEMQGRIRRFVDDRTQMIAAISHDLGTPITRMRLRAEFVENNEQRHKMLADLDDMEKMTSSVLSFARDDTANEPQTMVDLGALLHRVCDDAVDAGHKVTLAISHDALPYSCRPGALRRALGNLVDNAVKYGREAHVSLQYETGAIVIIIEDDGSGIAKERREDVFKPFHRLEQSRNRETGGTGLGLTVARTIIRAHGGDITLKNRDKGGLRVMVNLPQ